MLLTHFIWQTVLKPLSGTNAKNGAITPSLTPTMQARCYNAGKWVRATWRGITNLSKHVGALLVLYLGILWMALLVLVLVLGILWMSHAYPTTFALQDVYGCNCMLHAGDLVDVAGWGTVRCMQWWCCGFVFDDVDNFNDSAPSTEVL
jgi:hypothetical protein